MIARCDSESRITTFWQSAREPDQLIRKGLILTREEAEALEGTVQKQQSIDTRFCENGLRWAALQVGGSSLCSCFTARLQGARQRGTPGGWQVMDMFNINLHTHTPQKKVSIYPLRKEWIDSDTS